MGNMEAENKPEGALNGRYVSLKRVSDMDVDAARFNGNGKLLK